MSNITLKDSYVMYKNWSKGIYKLTDEQAGQLLKTICSFQDGEDVEPDDIAVSALFELFKLKMNEDADNYQAKVERLTENLKGKSDSQKGKKKSQKEKSNSQKGESNSQKENETDQKTPVATVSVTVTDTDTVTDTEKIKDIKESYGELGNVKLTVQEREKLIAEYGLETTEKAIDFLDGYIADKGYKSKSNYQAIRRWVIDAVKGRAAPKEEFDVDAYLRERAGLA